MAEPHFEPKPGQIDYTNAKQVPVVHCVVRHENRILLVQRSAEMKLYPSAWSGISGFLDDRHGIENKAREELQEEANITGDDIVSITEGEMFEEDDPTYGKTWIVHPVRVEVKTDRVTLNWEGQNYKWVTIEEIENIGIVPGFMRVLENLALAE